MLWSHYLRSDPLFENGFTFPEIMKIKHPASFEIENIFRVIIKIFSEAKGMWQLDCRIELLKLLRIIIKDVSDVNSKNDIHKGEKQKITLIVAYYIHKNYQRKLTLGEIAEVLNLHEDYVGKIFKRETGESFTLYCQKFWDLKTELTVTFILLSLKRKVEAIFPRMRESIWRSGDLYGKKFK